MAGYDFTFNVPPRFRPSARRWLRFFSATARAVGLQVSYRTKQEIGRRVECYVAVDGPLATMQSLERELPGRAEVFAGAIDQPKAMLKSVVVPFLRANREGVGRITEGIQEVVELSRSYGLPARIGASALNPAVRHRARQSRPKGRVSSSQKALIEIFDLWYARGEPNHRVVILADQAMEELLKVLVGLAKKDRRGFGDVLKLAVGSGLLTRHEAYRLRRFHRTRNSVQHRGGKVRTSTVKSLFDFYVHLLNEKLGGSG